MKTNIAIIFSTLVLVCACGEPQSCEGTYTNPVMAGDYPDPSIIRDGDDYYLTNSSFNYNPGLIVYHSTDLVHWEPISCALSTYVGSVYAPDICKVDGKFRIYTTVPGRGHFVVEAESPYGPWSEPLFICHSGIDPCFVIGDDGRRWLYESGGRRIPLSEDGLSATGAPEKNYDGWEYPSDWITECMCLEGPKVRKIGDWWYYVCAEGGTAGPATSHMVVMARSKSIDGPWENSPYNPVVHTQSGEEKWWSRGHGSLIDTPDGRWYVIYHSYEKGFNGIGRQTLLEPLELTEDGWFKPVEGLDVAEPIALPLPENPVDLKAHLAEFRIGFDWKFYKEYDPGRFSVADGTISIKGRGFCPADSAPLLFISGDHAFEFSMEIKKEPGAIPGLVLFYNHMYYTGIALGEYGTVRYRRDGGGLITRLEDTNHIWLKLIKDENGLVTSQYSLDGETWIQEGWGTDVSGYNHNTLSEFQALLPGIFVGGEGTATFSNFKYEKR